MSGGSFLVDSTVAGAIFIPEDLSDEQKSIQSAARDFFQKEVAPASEKIEKQEEGVSVGLLKKAGELGFLMVEVPERLSGLGMDKRTATALTEESSVQGSFSVTFMCHTGIGTLPILYYGTEAQKQKYLPKLASGEFVGAYALTEAGSGSDALGAKTKAVLSADGKHYVLNGSKMWITNGRWADVITVFAKVDGDKFTAFLVEKGMPGLSYGAEEKKMGIKGSNTVVLNLDNLQVPVENVLGDVGKGHKIAFNILNIGRWKLGAATLGGCKRVLTEMARYTQERKQFGKAISEFGMIRKKLADSVTRAFALESMSYRIAGLYDDAIAKLDKNDANYDRHCMDAIEDFAIEASIAKVYGSEALWAIADEGVQSLGGFGFSAEYPMEVIQRDSRINRIFEGTNEINRLIIPGTLLKRAMAGKIAFMESIQSVLGELKNGFQNESCSVKDLQPWADRVSTAKKLVVYASGVAVQKYADDIQNQQFALERMADLVIDAFVVESCFKRTLQLVSAGRSAVDSNLVQAMQVVVTEAYDRLQTNAKALLADVADNNLEEWGKIKKALAKFDAFDPIALSPIKNKLAEAALARGGYPLI